MYKRRNLVYSQTYLISLQYRSTYFELELVFIVYQVKRYNSNVTFLLCTKPKLCFLFLFLLLGVRLIDLYY